MTSKSLTLGHIATAVVLVLSAGMLAAFLPHMTRSTTRSCTTVLDSEVCAWIVLEGDHAVELGATIPMTLVEAVSADTEMVWPPEHLGVLELPPEAREALGIDHLGINWEAHGHPPGTFLTPHFDFHFYSISQAAVRAIDCTDLSKPSTLPARYVLPDIDIPEMGTLVGLCVPRMGMHAMPQTDNEETAAFKASMIIGYYGGAPIFFEPMVSQALLLERSDFSLPTPMVEHLPEGVRYPREFHVKYDAANDQYRMVMSGFDAR